MHGGRADLFWLAHLAVPQIPHEFNDPLVTFLGADIIYWNDRIVTLLGWSAGIPEFCATRGQAVAGRVSSRANDRDRREGRRGAAGSDEVNRCPIDYPKDTEAHDHARWFSKKGPTPGGAA